MKILKYVLLGIGALVVVLGAVIAYVAATFDPNAYKPEIIQLVKEKKNRTLKLDGDLRLSFWPNIGAELGKASLSEFKSDKEFAAVERARVSVKLMPLLSNQMVVDEVTVKGARAAIVRFKDGRMNIDDLLAKDEKDESRQVVFDIAQVVIEDSAFSFRDEAKGAQYSALQGESQERAHREQRADENRSCGLDPEQPAQAQSRHRLEDEAHVRSRQAGLRAGRHGPGSERGRGGHQESSAQGDRQRHREAQDERVHHREAGGRDDRRQAARTIWTSSSTRRSSC